MSVEFVRNKAQEILINGGRAALHSQAPDDFEYYACTFQLINSNLEIEQIFNFPVMPNSIQINKRPLVNIKKTARGYLDQFSTSFSGDTISINGTFGRKFRLIVSDNQDFVSEEKIPGKTRVKEFLYGEGTFDAKVKTGYGALKLMEKIVYRSTSLDEYGNPMRLYFYNFAFNEAFFVEVINWSKQQSLENNAMWNYSIELKCLATADSIEQVAGYAQKSVIKNLLATNAIQKSLNNTFNNLTAGGTADLLRNITQ